MHDCTITASAGRSSLTVVIIGHASAKLPTLVEREAARIAKGEASSPATVLCDDGRFLLVKPESKPHHTGGETWRILGGVIAAQARSAKATDITVHADGKQADVQSLSEGILLGDYRYDVYKTGKDAKRAAITVRIPGHAAAIERGRIIAKAQNLARELADTPPNEMNPAAFVTYAKRVLRGTGIEIKVISGVEALRRANFPGLVAVGQGSVNAPALLEMRWRPRRASSKRHLALVGKGITFDTGGISIKPGADMWEMKMDMSGAAAVLGAMTAIAETKPSIAITGWCALAENMPDGKAQRPGDIYRARNGKSIHVDNTDAEGRLVLSDVLTYAGEQGATHCVDIATLTGACVIALGGKVGGLLSRHDRFAAQVRDAGQETGEELWRMPLWPEYRQQIDFVHADVNNTGGRGAGTITAGLFLAEFVDPAVEWAHLDIAGPAMASGPWKYYQKGSTGFATRSLIRLAHALA